jgi:hypothetical protein
MDALLKNVNIEELNKVIDSNKQVTSVLSELMTKWRGINDFSHGKNSTENPG